MQYASMSRLVQTVITASLSRPLSPVKPFVRKPAFEVIEELDATNRPKQRVALLCGPPGLGKTTLAHVLARHAGQWQRPVATWDVRDGLIVCG